MQELIFIGIVLLMTVLGYVAGRKTNSDELKKSWNETITAQCKYQSLRQEFVTVEKVRHNLNCLVGDLKADLDYERSVGTGLLADNKLLKADALAFNSLKGKWVTDKKHLVEFNQRKECFRCIGFPERRL